MSDTQRRLLVDVDGCCGDLMGGFCVYLGERAVELTKPQITKHSLMGNCENLREVDEELRQFFPEPGTKGGIGGAFLQFMQLPNVYQEYVKPIEFSQTALDAIRVNLPEIQPVFVTAMMTSAPDNYGSKFRWLREHYNTVNHNPVTGETMWPDIPMCVIPSGLKHMFGQPGDIVVEDRHDTCLRWEGERAISLLMRQPWNEAPPGTKSYDGWMEIYEQVTSILRR